jgi:uncharacterized membrane protein
MENEMDDLKSIWKSAKGNTGNLGISPAALIRQAEAKKRNAIVSHFWNIGILFAVVVMLVACFYFFFPFQEVLSRIGIGFMIGGLLLRIAIEFFSIRKSNKVKVSDATAQATEDTLAFYEFRKKIHGPVTLSIVFLYIAGFYMLSPEFSKYIPETAMVIMDVGFLVGAIVMALFIRTGIRKELEDLKSVVEIKKALMGGL